MSLPYVLAQGILVGKVMSDDKTNWKVLIPYTCQFLIGNVRQKRKHSVINSVNLYQFLIGNVRHDLTGKISIKMMYKYQFLIGNVRLSIQTGTEIAGRLLVSIPHR